jgi:hypothetical protein
MMIVDQGSLFEQWVMKKWHHVDGQSEGFEFRQISRAWKTHETI